MPGIGAQSAVGGGGRYNGLVKECGGPDTPGVGFALGLDRLLLALELVNPQIFPDNLIEVFIIATNEAWEAPAMRFLNDLRIEGIRSDKDYSSRSFKAQMKYADKLGARLVVIIGEDEAANNYYTVKDMATGQQEQVLQADIIEYIQAILNNS